MIHISLISYRLYDKAHIMSHMISYLTHSCLSHPSLLQSAPPINDGALEF